MKDTKAILITGGARRIGREMALRFARDGYDIALHYSRSEADAQRTADDIKALGRSVSLHKADLMDSAAASALIASAHKAQPRLYGLVLNASIFEPSPFETTDEAMLDAYFQLHLKSSFFLAQAFASNIKRGSIIAMLDTNVSGHASVHFSYLLSKKALADLARMLARELAPAIRVNAIAPGLTSLSDDVSAQAAAIKAQTLPLARIAQPEDIADAASYLMQASYLTGHTLYIDGGQQLT